MMFLEKVRCFFSIFPVISAPKPMKMAKTDFRTLTLYNTTCEFAYGKLEPADGKIRLYDTFTLPALYNATSDFADGKLERAVGNIRLYDNLILP